MPVFKIGGSGRLVQVDGIAVPAPRLSQTKEKRVESIIGLNLDRLFVGWNLALLGTSSGQWKGADLSAGDTSGTRHVIEVKYGASQAQMLEQVLAYGVDLSRLSDDDWGKWRAASSTSGTRKMLESASEGVVTNEAVTEATGRLESARSGLPQSSRVRRDVHMHLVAPSFSEDLLAKVMVLRQRYVRISCWQVALDPATSMFSFDAAQSGVAEGKKPYTPNPYGMLRLATTIAKRHGEWLGKRLTYPFAENPLGLSRHKVHLSIGAVGAVCDFHGSTGRLTAMDWHTKTSSNVVQRQENFVAWLGSIGVPNPHGLRGKDVVVDFGGRQTKCKLSASGNCVTITLLGAATADEHADWLVKVLKGQESAYKPLA